MSILQYHSIFELLLYFLYFVLKFLRIHYKQISYSYLRTKNESTDTKAFEIACKENRFVQTVNTMVGLSIMKIHLHKNNTDGKSGKRRRNIWKT